MKRIFILLLVIISVVSVPYAQSGKVDCQSMKSAVLNRDMKYCVYLPAGYETSTRPYPVLYLLHGMTGDQNDWTVKGDARFIADEAFKSGKAPEMIIIMPDGLFDAFYINNYDKSIKWEDFFYQEFIPQVEKKYRVIGNRSNRAIAGLSMGGYGATYHGLSHKEMFSSVYAMSAAYIERKPVKAGETVSDWDKNFNLKLWGPMNAEGLPENYKKHSIQEMIKGMEKYKTPSFSWTPGPPGPPALFIDCGDDDFLIQVNMDVAKLLKEKEIPFEFRVHQGGHTWDYWRTALKDALHWIGGKFLN